MEKPKPEDIPLQRYVPALSLLPALLSLLCPSAGLGCFRPGFSAVYHFLESFVLRSALQDRGSRRPSCSDMLP